MSSDRSSGDISNPFFVRFYRRNRRSAVKRGENEHRQRALAGGRDHAASASDRLLMDDHQR